MILVSYYGNMFRSVLDHLQANEHCKWYSQCVLYTVGYHINYKVYVKAIKNIIFFCKGYNGI